jgi:ABC-2 type transport system permease protein
LAVNAFSILQYRVALYTITRREITRFLRIWGQTILPSAITMTLYFIVFGGLVGDRIGTMQGFHYAQYITPGLVMMSVITNSYTNVTSSFYLSKFQRNI